MKTRIARTLWPLAGSALLLVILLSVLGGATPVQPVKAETSAVQWTITDTDQVYLNGAHMLYAPEENNGVGILFGTKILTQSGPLKLAVYTYTIGTEGPNFYETNINVPFEYDSSFDSAAGKFIGEWPAQFVWGFDNQAMTWTQVFTVPPQYWGIKHIAVVSDLLAVEVESDPNYPLTTTSSIYWGGDEIYSITYNANQGGYLHPMMDGWFYRLPEVQGRVIDWTNEQQTGLSSPFMIQAWGDTVITSVYSMSGGSPEWQLPGGCKILGYYPAIGGSFVGANGFYAGGECHLYPGYYYMSEELGQGWYLLGRWKRGSEFHDHNHLLRITSPTGDPIGEPIDPVLNSGYWVAPDLTWHSVMSLTGEIWFACKGENVIWGQISDGAQELVFMRVQGGPGRQSLSDTFGNRIVVDFTETSGGCTANVSAILKRGTSELDYPYASMHFNWAHGYTMTISAGDWNTHSTWLLTLSTVTPYQPSYVFNNESDTINHTPFISSTTPLSATPICATTAIISGAITTCPIVGIRLEANPSVPLVDKSTWWNYTAEGDLWIPNYPIYMPLLLRNH